MTIQARLLLIPLLWQMQSLGVAQEPASATQAGSPAAAAAGSADPDREAFDKAREAFNGEDYPAAQGALAPLVKQGYAPALHLWAFMLESGLGVAKNPARAVFYYQKAILKKYPDSFCNLGTLYLEGEGVAISFPRALELFRQGAELGNSLAMRNLGVMYEDGKGVPADPQKAFALYTQAIGRDQCPDAMESIGALYRDGRGTPQNLDMALWYFGLAAEQGLDLALEDLKNLPEQKDAARPVLFYKVSRSHPECAVALPSKANSGGFSWYVTKLDKNSLTQIGTGTFVRTSQPGSGGKVFVGVGGTETWRFRAQDIPDEGMASVVTLAYGHPWAKAKSDRPITLVVLGTP